MSQGNALRRGAGWAAFLALLAAAAGWVLLAGGAKRQEVVAAARAALRRPSGSAQLISSEPLPATDEDGEECEWIPASAGSSLFAALQEEASSGGNAARSYDTAATVDFSKRKPLRTIHDPYSAYSSVAVDPTHNEVVLTDENLFNVLVYDRLSNTPPAAKMTEPKRMIGGLNTKIEFQCGLYIDPQNGDIYAVNNDTVDRLVIFSRQAKGNVPPDREVQTPHGTFGIAVDEEHQELLLTVQHDSAVVTYRKTAKPDESPLRLLQGEHTLLADPHGMALDAKDDLIFVTNHGSVHQFRVSGSPRREGTQGRGVGKQNWPLGFSDALPGSGKNVPPSITVYPRTASGDTPPVRIIQGPKTQMDWPTGIAYNPRNNEILVANDMGDSILVFPASASGDAAPIRVLQGPKTGIKNPTGVYVDVQNDELWVANFGNHSATVYKPTASGDTAPLRVIRSGPLNQPALSIGNPHPIGYDSKREQILVPN
jgi:DNA-binding beta-propeller fold protein YncE